MGMHIELAGGGDLYVNRMGSLWTVDVFELGSDVTDDPIYHQSHLTMEAAMVDARSWRRWAEDHRPCEWDV